jgi:F0F1-type ATP synthase epsilon subunit
LVKPLERAIHEEVVPWLHGEIVKYLEEDKAVEAGKETVIEDGFISAKQEHVNTLKARQAAKERAIEEAKEAKRQKEIR